MFRWRPLFDSHFTIFELRNSGNIKFVMLFQDYFRCYFRTKGGKATRGSQEALLLIFVIWGCCFGCRGMRVGGVGQRVSFAFSCLVLLGEMGGGGGVIPGFQLVAVV